MAIVRRCSERGETKGGNLVSGVVPLLPSRWGLLVALLCGVVLMSAHAAGEGTPAGAEFQGFRKVGTREDGSMEYEITGEQAAVVGNGVKLTGVRLILFREDGEDPLEVTTPSCIYDRGTRHCTGTEPIRAVSGDFRLTGTGFLLDTASRKLTVRNDVTVRIRRANAGKDASTDLLAIPAKPTDEEKESADAQ